MFSSKENEPQEAEKAEGKDENPIMNMTETSVVLDTWEKIPDSL